MTGSWSDVVRTACVFLCRVPQGFSRPLWLYVTGTPYICINPNISGSALSSELEPCIVIPSPFFKKRCGPEFATIQTSSFSLCMSPTQQEPQTSVALPPLWALLLPLLLECLGGFDSWHCGKFSPCFTIFPTWRIPLWHF